MSKAVATHHHDIQQQTAARTTFGFWTYLMTDCVLFATLFATYAVLHENTAGGPGPKDIFDMPFVLVETLLLLTSSFTSGLAMLALQRQSKQGILWALGATFVLGAAFLGMELYEFSHLVGEGHSWKESAFLSSFFTLVGTHGAHIATGLLWLSVQAYQIYRLGITAHTSRRLTLFSLFWHFLDIVWIFIFTLVYLLGVI
jgi:cytochrome o ubiquinol oxidase subunit 3